jgi:hypothetical protein
MPLVLRCPRNDAREVNGDTPTAPAQARRLPVKKWLAPEAHGDASVAQLPNAVHGEDLISRPAREVITNQHITLPNFGQEAHQFCPLLEFFRPSALNLDPHFRSGITLGTAKSLSFALLGIEANSVVSLASCADSSVEKGAGMMDSGNRSHGFFTSGLGVETAQEDRGDAVLVEGAPRR